MITQTLSGVAIGVIPTTTVILAQVITGKTTVGLQEAVAVGVTIIGLVWWLGREFKVIRTTQQKHGRLLRILLEKSGVDPRLAEIAENDHEES